MARDAFGHTDDIHNDVVSDGAELVMEERNAEGEDLSNEENLEYLVRESAQQVFEGSTQNRLQCAIILFSLCSLIPCYIHLWTPY